MHEVLDLVTNTEAADRLNNKPPEALNDHGDRTPDTGLSFFRVGCNRRFGPMARLVISPAFL